MNRILAFVLTQLLAVHTVLGCCAHHGHLWSIHDSDGLDINAGISAPMVHSSMDQRHGHGGGCLHGLDSGHSSERPHACHGPICHFARSHSEAAAMVHDLVCSGQAIAAVIGAVTVTYSCLVTDCSKDPPLFPSGTHRHILLAVFLI